MQSKLRWIALLLIGLALAGCQTLGERQAEKQLTQTLRTFGAAVRWADLPKLYGFLKPELAAEAEMQAGLDNIKVTGYDVIDGPRSLSPRLARQTALIRYVHIDRQVVREIVDVQTWEHDAEAGKWYRLTPIPLFK